MTSPTNSETESYVSETSNSETESHVESIIQLLEDIKARGNQNISLSDDEKISLEFYRTNRSEEYRREIINHIFNKTRELYNGSRINIEERDYREIVYSYLYFGFSPRFLTDQQKSYNESEDESYNKSYNESEDESYNESDNESYNESEDEN